MKLNEMKFNVAQINLCTEAEGPYKRLAIWFQGCTIGCPGCCNPELQTMKPAHIISLDELIAIIKESKKENTIEGVTFLGGEPTLQSHLAELALHIHQEGLGVILFTGYEINQLNQSIISSVDLIIDGPFIEKLIDQKRNLVGSSNQKIHHITDRYTTDMNWFLKRRSSQVEVNVNNDLLFTGDVVIK